jgi:hypothetical protein
MAAGVILGVGLLCAVVVLYRRIKHYGASLDEMASKIETLTRLAESDGEALVDEPLPVEDLHEKEEEEEEEEASMSMYVIHEEEAEEEEEEEDDFTSDDDRPRVEELPSPPPLPAPPAKKPSRRKSPTKEKVVVFD